ncbi:type II secretion system protein [Clostridiaceae bacterium HSG29]|nr:type II secretion system protein [Clostridiaceae bacterium HSG29]
MSLVIMRIEDDNMKRILKNQNGVTLVEIIVSVAILSIISVSFFQILTGSFVNVINAGNSNKEIYLAAGELDIAIREQTYTGKNSNVTSVNENVDVLGTNINSRVIYSKSEDLETAIDINTDEYLYAYVIDNPTFYLDQAFIDLNGNKTYDVGEVIVEAELLNATYYQNGTGILVIPNQSSLTTTIDKIDWRVNDGIYVKTGIIINSLDDIYIQSLAGDIEFEIGCNIEATNNIELKALNKIDVEKNLIKTLTGDIEIYSKEVYMSGDNAIPTRLIIDDGQNISFYVDDSINMNVWTKFLNDLAAEIYANNENSAIINIANELGVGNEFK